MNADLHSHSVFSDGLLQPEKVVERAAAHGVELLALTDHDETAGLPMALQAAQREGITLVNGVEISCYWNLGAPGADLSIHVLGLGIDPDNERLQAGLARIRESRAERAER